MMVKPKGLDLPASILIPALPFMDQGTSGNFLADVGLNLLSR